MGLATNNPTRTKAVVQSVFREYYANGGEKRWNLEKREDIS